jgi:glutamate synthase domain-containing protein 1
VNNSDFPGLSFAGLCPPENGLWRPEYEQDSCGIGFVADLQGARSHSIVAKGVQAVSSSHRGAVAADQNRRWRGRSHRYRTAACVAWQRTSEVAQARRRSGRRHVLSRDPDTRHRCYAICDSVVEESGMVFLSWRRVPTDEGALGDIALKTCPEIRQLLLMRPEGMPDEAFKRTCYILRKQMEKRVAAEGIHGFTSPRSPTRQWFIKG